jgi:lipopolysaccharide transport system ATP-binding protein
MKPIAIRAQGLGKKYLSRELSARADLRESIAAAARIALRFRERHTVEKPAAAGASRTEDFKWALRNVSFEIEEGEIVGIIGGNGSGKTTLLRILSGITHPTEGVAEIGGTIAVLLDPGAGFHGELTGAENVRLYGELLGMSRSEARGKLAAIVEFAELERFTDTPLKRYSSGMCVRLAFAVAAHTDSPILFVDEALASTDAAFHRKCVETMIGARGRGKTSLIVSHDLDLMRQLCGRAMVMAGGRLIRIGPAEETIAYYRDRTFAQAPPPTAFELQEIKMRTLTCKLS